MDQPAHSETAHQQISVVWSEPSLIVRTPYDYWCNKTSCGTSEDSGQYAPAHSDKSIRWSYLPSIAGLSKEE